MPVKGRQAALPDDRRESKGKVNQPRRWLSLHFSSTRRGLR